ncbi:MAG: ATP-binding cassette domain-containing protein [Pirellulales bacterium]|nr:ATP-binding cassette domain-containing protein [Pirellulales bacterium]
MTSTTTNACSIRCDAVSVSFAGGVTAVDDVTLLVRPGEFFSLIGPSGCGKTTLLRMMAGLQPATGGQVWVDPPADAKSGEVAAFCSLLRGVHL